MSSPSARSTAIALTGWRSSGRTLRRAPDNAPDANHDVSTYAQGRCRANSLVPGTATDPTFSSIFRGPGSSLADCPQISCTWFGHAAQRQGIISKWCGKSRSIQPHRTTIALDASAGDVNDRQSRRDDTSTADDQHSISFTDRPPIAAIASRSGAQDHPETECPGIHRAHIGPETAILRYPQRISADPETRRGHLWITELARAGTFARPFCSANFD
jgi:hypothetical protein